MRLLAKSYDHLNNSSEAFKWARRACAEAPNTREPWVELSMLCYRHKMWAECYSAAKNALAIKDKALVYTMDPTVWGYTPHDLAAISAYNLGLYKDAAEQGEIAVQLEPNDTRLQTNLEFYLKSNK